MSDILVEGIYGHGALPPKLDLRDFKYSKIAKMSEPFDWAIGFDAESVFVKTKDQGISDSCGGQSGSYLDALINGCSERSARYIYSHIFYKGGGTTMRDILSFIVKQGVADEALVPSYQGGMPPSESFMRDTSLDANGDASAAPYEAAGYAFVNADIDSYAQAIRDNGGAIMQINGKNNGTWLSTDPLPALSLKDSIWSHFVVCTAACMRNGKKCIKIHNSWGNKAGENGYQYISEDHFKNGCILQGGVVFKKTNPVIDPTEVGKITLMTKIIALLQQLINMKRNIGGWFAV